MIGPYYSTGRPKKAALSRLLAILNALSEQSSVGRDDQKAPQPVKLGEPEAGLFLTQVVDSAGIGCWIWDEVTDRCIYCSDKLASLHGLSVEDYYAKRGSFDARLEEVHPEDRAHYYRSISRARVCKQPYVVDLRELTVDGRLRVFRERGEPILDEVGEIAYTIGTVQDISETKLSEADLLDGETRYRELLESSPVPLRVEDWSPLKALLDSLAREGVKDLPGYFRENWDRLLAAYAAPQTVEVSQAALRTYRASSEQDLIATRISGQAGPDALAGFCEQMVRLYGGAAQHDLEAQETACDGSRISTRTRVVIPRRYRDTWSRVFISVEDISEAKARESQRLESARLEAVSRLAAGVAHAFNNLLAIILGRAEVIAESLGEGNKLARRLDSVIRSCERGADVTQQLLAFARMQSLRPQAVDLGEVLAAMGPTLRQILGGRVEVEIGSSPASWRVLADPQQLKNVILELATNAGAAMADGGKLTIETETISVDEGPDADHHGFEPGDYVMLVVSDTGHGMLPAVLGRAFEPFFTTKGWSEHSGLGLSTVFGFAKQSGGQVAIESAEDGGTKVRLYLPRSDAEPA